MRPLLLALVVGTLALSAIAVTRHIGSPSQATRRIHSVAPQEQPTALHEHVFITSAARTPVPTLISGTITWVVAEGTWVNEGDVVVRVDPADKQKKHERLLQEIERRQTSLERYEMGRELARLTSDNEAVITEAELKYARLRIEQQIQQQGLDPQQRRIMAIDAELARIDLEAAKDSAARDHRMHDKGLLSSARLEESGRALQVAQAAVEERELAIALSEQGPDAAARAELESELARARGSEERSQARLERWLERIEQDIAIEQARLERDQVRLDRLAYELEHTVLYAPCDGIVILRRYRDKRGGGRLVPAGPGMERHPGDPLIDIVDPSEVEAVMMVNEADYEHLRLDMPVRLQLTAYPEQSIDGHIAFLAGIARDRGAIRQNDVEHDNTGVNVFSAVLHLDSSLSARPGMTGTVTIPLPEQDPLLVIPHDLVHEDADGIYVMRLQDDETQRCAIEGRPYGHDGFLVQQGLQPGDRLVATADMPAEERS